MAVDDLADAAGQAVPQDRIARFLTGISGAAIRPDDPLYEPARHTWNASVDKRPGLIVRCSGAADVVRGVEFARENGLLVAVRGGGHNVAGRALCDRGLVLDLSAMKGIHVDAVARTARVQAGVTLGDVDRETHLCGLAVPAGVVSATGIAGLTLGGGVGWLMRKHGLTCDNVISMQVVTADGRLLTASVEENPDLFWALRGGGGNFGVVTSFLFRLHPVSTVLAGMVAHPRAAARDVLRYLRDFMPDAPDELTVYASLSHTPDGAPVVSLAACWCGDVAEGERVLEPLRRFGAPVLDAFAQQPFPQFQKALDPSFPDGNFNYWKSSFLRHLDDDAVEVLVEHANRAASPLSKIIIEYYGGAVGRVPADATAFAHRDTLWDIGILAQWSDPAETPREVAWARDYAAALKPFATGGFYLNFLDADEDDAIRGAFGPNYDRLVAVKTKYDPENLFRVNQNILPRD